MRGDRKRRSLTKLATILSGSVAFVLLERFYFMRELLLFVALAAVLVFFAGSVAVLGILAHAAVQSMFRSVRMAKARVVSQGT